MDGRKDQVVLIQRGRPRKITTGLWRIKSQFAEEALTCRELNGNTLELLQFTGTDLRRFVDPIEVWLVPISHTPGLAFPRAIRPQCPHQFSKRGPGFGG